MSPTAIIDPPKPFVPNGESLYEIVGGEFVEKPAVAAFSAWIAFILATELQNFARKHRLGRAVTEALFNLNLPGGRNRCPDVAYISFDRCPAGQLPPPDDNAWNVVPDLAVEVVSPSNDVQGLQRKIAEYFQAGVRLVWIVFPESNLVHIYHSLKSIAVVGDGDILDGGDVLPGFQIPVHNLFHEVA